MVLVARNRTLMNVVDTGDLLKGYGILAQREPGSMKGRYHIYVPGDKYDEDYFVSVD